MLTSSWLLFLLVVSGKYKFAVNMIISRCIKSNVNIECIKNVDRLPIKDYLVV